MPDPGLPPPTRPSNLPLDKWLHDFWAWVRTFVQRVVAANSSVTVTTKNGVVSISANGASVDASYATVNNESATLPDSRHLAAGANVTLTDGGPGGPLTIAASGGTVSPLTTKGDVWGFSTVNARIPVGADGKVLTADSTAALGVSYQTPTTYAPTSAEYVLVAPNGALSQARTLAAGTHITITDGGAGGNITIGVTGITASPLTTKGDLWGFSTVDARVPVGSDGQVLTADSTQTLGVKWSANAAIGGVVLIASVTTSGSQASVDFTSIPSIYAHLRIVWLARDTQAGTGGVALRLQMNGDATAANYTSSFRLLNASGAAVVTSSAATTTGVQVGLIPQDGNTAGISAGGEINIPAYAQTTFFKRAVALFGEDDATNGNFNGTTTFRWSNTASINRLTLFSGGTGFKNGSVISLYGFA